MLEPSVLHKSAAITWVFVNNIEISHITYLCRATQELWGKRKLLAASRKTNFNDCTFQQPAKTRPLFSASTSNIHRDVEMRTEGTKVDLDPFSGQSLSCSPFSCIQGNKSACIKQQGCFSGHGMYRN